MLLQEIVGATPPKHNISSMYVYSSPHCAAGQQRHSHHSKSETTVVVTSIPVSAAGLHDRWDEGTGQNHKLSIKEKKGTCRQRPRIPNSLKVLTVPVL